MQVTVTLIGSFRLKWFKEMVLYYDHDAELIDIVNDVGMPVEEVGIILINGRHSSLQNRLRDGDIVTLMPLIGGG